jgi:hypothetical protein
MRVLARILNCGSIVQQHDSAVLLTRKRFSRVALEHWIFPVGQSSGSVTGITACNRLSLVLIRHFNTTRYVLRKLRHCNINWLHTNLARQWRPSEL